jgi:hypothetical protein
MPGFEILQRPSSGNPFVDERGCAIAGRGRDEGQFLSRRETLVQPLDQAATASLPIDNTDTTLKCLYSDTLVQL